MNFPQLLPRDRFVIEMQLPGGEHIPRRKRHITKRDVGDMSDNISNVFNRSETFGTLQESVTVEFRGCRSEAEGTGA